MCCVAVALPAVWLTFCSSSCCSGCLPVRPGCTSRGVNDSRGCGGGGDNSGKGQGVHRDTTHNSLWALPPAHNAVSFNNITTQGKGHNPSLSPPPPAVAGAAYQVTSTMHNTSVCCSESQTQTLQLPPCDIHPPPSPHPPTVKNGLLAHPHDAEDLACCCH